MTWLGIRMNPTHPKGMTDPQNASREDLPYWPVLDQDKQYLQLDIQPAVAQALKADKLHFRTKILPQKIVELIGSKMSHSEL
jgi:hypothetical protein